MQKKVAHIKPVQVCHSPVAEPAVTVSYIPELTELDLLVQITEGLTYLEHSAPGYQLCYCQPLAEHVCYASK